MDKPYIKSINITYVYVYDKIALLTISKLWSWPQIGMNLKGLLSQVIMENSRCLIYGKEKNNFVIVKGNFYRSQLVV